MTTQGADANNDTFKAEVRAARSAFEVSLREHTTMSQGSLDVVMESFDSTVAEITTAVVAKSVEIARDTLRASD